MKSLLWLPLVLFPPFLFASSSFAQTNTVYASYKYIMGDNDTKNDAKRICFLHASRRALEKAGVYIQSHTEVQNLILTRDEIKSYTAALLNVELVREKIVHEGETIAVYMTVKAEIDITDLKEKIIQIKENKPLQERFTKQRLELDDLERRMRNMQRELKSADYEKAIKIRRVRKEVFGKLDALLRIKLEIKRKGTLALEKIEVGMTPNEVINLIGKPRATKSSLMRDPRYNYGIVWVIFQGGVVQCLVKTGDFSKFYGCGTYRLRGEVVK